MKKMVGVLFLVAALAVGCAKDKNDETVGGETGTIGLVPVENAYGNGYGMYYPVNSGGITNPYQMCGGYQPVYVPFNHNRTFYCVDNRHWQYGRYVGYQWGWGSHRHQVGQACIIGHPHGCGIGHCYHPRPDAPHGWVGMCIY